MPAALTTAAHGGARRGSPVTVVAALLAALLCLSTVATAFADEPSASLTPEQQRVENVITAAKQYLGVPYRIGGEGPALFDCSGLVFRAFSDVGLVDRIGNARLRAAGYMRWFNSRGQMTTDESQAQRGDLVVYNNGTHIGIYLGDGRVISALINPYGITVHSLDGVGLAVTGFLRPDWSGDGEVAPFVPVDLSNLPDVEEAPASLVPAADWMPAADAALSAPADRDGAERVDLRTPNTRTFENADGTFTTEFHVQPIFYTATDENGLQTLEPIDLTFQSEKKTGYASVAASSVAVTARPADDPAGFLSVASGDLSVSLSVADSKATPQIVDNGRVVDFFDFQAQHVGLRVQPHPDGFKGFIVLGKSPDRNRFSFVLNAPGLTPSLAEDGSIVLTAADGTAAGRIARPLLLDSSDVDGHGGGVFTAAASLLLDTTGELPVISVVVDRAFLEEAVMPAFVDFSLTDFPQASAGADLAFASSSHPNASMLGYQRPESAGFDELWLGHQPDSRNDNEVFVRFQGLNALLGTVDVASASLELLPYLTGSADSTALVSRIAADWTPAALTWLTRPATDLANVPATLADKGWSTVDVSQYVTDVLSLGTADYGLALSGAESAAGLWARIAGSDTGEAAQFGPRLVVNWSGVRPTPVLPATDAYLTESPTLTWSLPYMAGVQDRFEVQLSRDGFTTIDVDSGAVKGADGKAAAWTVPADALTSTASYAWRVRVHSESGANWSEWSAPQSFNFTLPAPPAIPVNAVL